MTNRRKWVLVGTGLLLAAGVVHTAYRAHRIFRESLVETFVAQQSMFIRALGTSVREYVESRERDMENVIGQIRSGPATVDLSPQRLAALHQSHLQGFESVSIHDHAGALLAASPPAREADQTRLVWIRDIVRKSPDRRTVFVSDSFVGFDFKTMVFLFVPFDVPGVEGGYAVGGLQVEDYLSKHLSAWRGRSMVVVLGDDDGSILSLLNSTHEKDQRMKLGNLHELDEPCLKCHPRDAFDDVRKALASRDVEHTLFVPPGGRVSFNRATLALDVYNERWVITLVSPFEGVQSALDRQTRTQLLFAGFALFALAGLGYALHRVADLRHVAEANEALRVSQRQLEEANRLKDLFTDIVRHDIMSPLSAGIGYAELLDEARCAPDGAHLVPALRRCLRRASAIIDSAATLSRLEDASSVELQEGDLAELIDGVLAQQAPALRSAGLAVLRRLEGPCPVRANPPLLEQVFANLLGNAAKYAAAGGKVEVGVESRGGRWVARVKDWGEGIPDAAKERVFDRLMRLNKDGIKGSGLGLAIVRRIVTLHGGEVWVEDNPEGGSVFLVALPKAPGAAGGVAGAPGGQSPAA